jgi:hypothetical protein
MNAPRVLPTILGKLLIFVIFVTLNSGSVTELVGNIVRQENKSRFMITECCLRGLCFGGQAEKDASLSLSEAVDNL